MRRPRTELAVNRPHFAAVTLVVFGFLATAFGGLESFWVARFSETSPGAAVEGWRPHTFPKIHRHTRFSLVRDGEQTVLRAESEHAASGLVKKVEVDPERLPILEWRWRVEGVIESSRWADERGDDFAARLFVIFASDGGVFSFFDHLMKKMAGGFKGKALCYVWTRGVTPGTLASSPYTDSVAMIAVESDGDNVGKWVSERRNVAHDFRQAFGKPSPPIVAVAVMADTDDTGAHTVAYYGDIRFTAQ